MFGVLNWLVPVVFATAGLAAIGTIVTTAIPQRRRMFDLAAQGFGL
jgi:hypothetical protein